MRAALLLAATLATAIFMVAGCGQEGAGQGSGHKSDAEPRPTPQARDEQPEKPQTDKKGEVAKKPSQEHQQHKDEQKHKQKPKSKPEHEPAPRNIPGLTPQDVYLNLEEKGFECSEPELMRPEDEVRWTCKRQEAKGEYVVEISSKDANSVRLLEAKVTSHDPARADALAGDFLGYVARVPYDGAQPKKAQAWVENNVGSKASAKFGGVSYTLDTKADSRFLRLEKLGG
jgi:outer membrane biosynthesis protein TonB